MFRLVISCALLVLAPASARSATPSSGPDAAPTTVAPDGDPAAAGSPAATPPSAAAEMTPRASFGRRFGRAQAAAAGLDAFAFAALLALPPEFSNWERPPFRDTGSNLRRAWTTPPVVDRDSAALNWVAHPYAGSLTYNAMRAQGSGWHEAFLFSTLQSLIWEYGIEAMMEQPSAQDLAVTSTVGSLLGEGAHQVTRRLERGGFRVGEKVVVALLNPMDPLLCGFRPGVRLRRCPA